MNESWFHRAESLTVQQMHTFCCVYEKGGYADASEHLGLAGPTIWEQVKVLERIYQTPLFERVGRSVRPTAAGHALYELMSPLLASVESTFERLAEETDDIPKQVCLVTGVRMMLEELASPLREFQKLFPDVQLKLMTADNRAAQQWVVDGKADLALLIEPPLEFIAQGIACERLYPIDYLAALPPRHRLTRKPNLRLSDLTSEPLIVGNRDTVGRQMLEQACFRLGITDPLQIVVETDNSAITIACARAGLGVGILAGKSAGNLARHVATRSLANQIGQVNVVAAYRLGRQLTRVLQTLLQLMRNCS